MNGEMQALLDHQQWVQRLAQKLVSDPNVADDLAQETFLAALRAKGPPARSMRAWLGAVLRNLLWERMRSEDRRATREKRVVSDEAAPSTVELVERMSVHRNVVEVVMELPEHYREVLLWRYFEGETPTQIAERIDVPISTVKTRLQRALERMRERLDERHGGDGIGWMGALMPLLRGREATLVSAGASSGISLSWIVAGLVLLGAGLGVHLWGGGAADTDTHRAQLTRVASPTPEDAAGPARSSSAEALRNELSESGRSREEEDALLASLASLRASQPGIVLDVEGRGASGVVVMFEVAKFQPGEVETGVSIAVSDSEGRFTLEGVDSRGRMRVAGTESVTVLSGSRSGRDRDEALLVIAPRLEIAGQVVDAEGHPIDGARLELLAPSDLRARFGEGLERSSACFFRCESGPSGAFDFAGAPRIAGATLKIVRGGFLEHTLEAPLVSEGVMRIEMQRIGYEVGRITGRVLDHRGKALADARISSGSEILFSDGEGLFHFDPRLRNAFGKEPNRLVAWKPGHGPGQLFAKLEQDSTTAVWPEGLELALQDEALSIAGRVVDERQRPLKGVRVWLADATVFEDRSDPHEGSIESRSLLPGEPSPLELPQVLESMIADEKADPLRYASTDEGGFFRIEGLLDREYTLEVIDRASLSRARSKATRAGSEGLEIVLDLSDTDLEWTGRVVSHFGEPVAGVALRLAANAQEVRQGERSLLSQRISRGKWVSDEDGRFVFRDVPRTGVYFQLESPRILPMLYHPAKPSPDSQGNRENENDHDYEIVVALRAQVQIQLNDPDEADAFELLSSSDERLGLLSLQGTKRVQTPRATLHAGRSEVLQTASHAEILALLKEGVEIRRIPVTLRPGVVNELRF